MTLESVFEESLFNLGNTMVFDSTEPISEWHSYLYELLIKKKPFMEHFYRLDSPALRQTAVLLRGNSSMCGFLYLYS